MKLIYLIVPMAILAGFILTQIFYSYKAEKDLKKQNKYPRAFKTPKVVDMKLDKIERNIS